MTQTLPGILLAAILALSSQYLTADERDARNDEHSVGLALGSGGAAGLAHIAMLQVFDDLEIKPARISGTSIGAVIGMLYAAGLSADEIRDVFDEFGGSGLDVLSALTGGDADLSLTDVWDLDLDNGGLFSSEGFMEFLAGKIAVTDFDELQIPLEVVATDFWSGDTVVFSEGDLLQAVKASMAVPGLFSPVRIDDMLLIDGGTSNPLPHGLLYGHHDLLIAIDVTGRREPDDDEVNWINMLFKTFEVMQQSLISSQMREKEPDIYIKPDISGVRLLEFNRVDDILEQAESSAEELRHQLVNKLSL